MRDFLIFIGLLALLIGGWFIYDRSVAPTQSSNHGREQITASITTLPEARLIVDKIVRDSIEIDPAANQTVLTWGSLNIDALEQTSVFATTRAQYRVDCSRAGFQTISVVFGSSEETDPTISVFGAFADHNLELPRADFRALCRYTATAIDSHVQKSNGGLDTEGLIPLPRQRPK